MPDKPEQPFRLPVPAGTIREGDIPKSEPEAISRDAELHIGSVRTGDVKLTDQEKATLTRLGWKEGDAIPTNLAEIMQMSELASGISAPDQSVRLPASTEGAESQPISFTQREAGKAALSEAQEAMQQTQTFVGADASVQHAMSVAAGGGEAPEVQIEDDREEKEPTGDETGALSQMGNCPHCNWDLRYQDTVKVADEDKQDFLRSILGQVPFYKTYGVLDGALRVQFRSLSPADLDACFEQAYEDRKAGKLELTEAYVEQLNRYRLSLQLARIESGKEINHVFPESLDEWYQKLCDRRESNPDNPVSIVTLVYQHIFGNVVRTETLNRILGGLCGDFNRLLNRLEANAPNSDFWSTTRLPT